MNKTTLTFVVLLVLVIGGFAALQAGSNGSIYSGSSSTTTASTTDGGDSTTSTTSTGISTSSGGSSSSSEQLIAAGQIKHVIIIVMENEGYGSVIGSASAPYENQLASRYALAGNYFAASHPSLPNYLALVAGDTLGVSSDCSPAQCSLSDTTITALLDARGLSWKEYAESMTSNCSQSDSQGLYATRHVPFVYFQSITGNSGSGATSAYCDAHVVPFTQFSKDLSSSNLPSYSFITPNLCDDAHSCSLSSGDQWLSTIVPGIIGSSSFSSTALFIVYDEGSNNAGFGPNSGGQVACILVSPFARPGYVSQVQYSHYSLLATVEAIFGTGGLGRNDATANVMSDMFSAPA
ncbi:MAG: alkaline phosphatase family protein [Thaumarchaeota archaeon]|nr:alkaline phosphatase family protein [Nitrososphaerota archaeon]